MIGEIIDILYDKGFAVIGFSDGGRDLTASFYIGWGTKDWNWLIHDMVEFDYAPKGRRLEAKNVKFLKNIQFEKVEEVYSENPNHVFKGECILHDDVLLLREIETGAVFKTKYTLHIDGYIDPKEGQLVDFTFKKTENPLRQRKPKFDLDNVSPEYKALIAASSAKGKIVDVDVNLAYIELSDYPFEVVAKIKDDFEYEIGEIVFVLPTIKHRSRKIMVKLINPS